MIQIWSECLAHTTDYQIGCVSICTWWAWPEHSGIQLNFVFQLYKIQVLHNWVLRRLAISNTLIPYMSVRSCRIMCFFIMTCTVHVYALVWVLIYLNIIHILHFLSCDHYTIWSLCVHVYFVFIICIYIQYNEAEGSERKNFEIERQNTYEERQVQMVIYVGIHVHVQWSCHLWYTEHIHYCRLIVNCPLKNGHLANTYMYNKYKVHVDSVLQVNGGRQALLNGWMIIPFTIF